MTPEPRFLSLNDVIFIHTNQIQLYGGSLGIRDLGALESAVEAPRWAFCYHSQSRCHLAACYLFHLVQNHGFVDGNKRVGTAAALAFLDLNGSEINAEDEDFIELVLGVAKGCVSTDEVAVFFEKHQTNSVDEK